MAPVGKYAAATGVLQPVVSLVIQVGDTGGPDVWVGFLGDVRWDDEDVGEYPCRFHMPDHEEAV